jgi:hypothetical protein
VYVPGSSAFDKFAAPTSNADPPVRPARASVRITLLVNTTNTSLPDPSVRDTDSRFCTPAYVGGGTRNCPPSASAIWNRYSTPGGTSMSNHVGRNVAPPSARWPSWTRPR